MSVLKRHEQFTLKSRKSRPSTVLAQTGNNVITTYTVDKDYITSVNLADNTSRKVLPLGYVVALDPSTKKIVPNYTSYGFGVVGVTLYDVDCGTEALNYDRVTEIVWRGEVLKDHCWDNGTYSSVLQATKAALRQRINFVDVTSSGKPGAIHFTGV